MDFISCSTTFQLRLKYVIKTLRYHRTNFYKNKSPSHVTCYVNIVLSLGNLLRNKHDAVISFNIRSNKLVHPIDIITGTLMQLECSACI